MRRTDATDAVDFAPRLKVPVLLMEGRNDFLYPYTTSQLPLFRLLGAPAKDKKLALYEKGHIGASDPQMFRAMLDWLDRYLGPVP